MYFRPDTIGLRSLIQKCKELFQCSVHHIPDSGGKGDIRELFTKEMKKYRNRFVTSAALFLPILFAMWVIPYSRLRNVMTCYEIYEGSEVTWYIVFIMTFSSIIQFCMGFPFYIGAYKSVSHGAANMDVLVVLGTTSAWLYGVILIVMRLTGHGKAANKKMEQHHAIHELVHNFEIAAGLITVILLGKYLESLSKK